MDYSRIYREFIADRKRREPILTGYTEGHHILPRVLGGTDDAANMIRLTPEDHLFAHLLLAKAHNIRPLWTACMIMLGAETEARRSISLRGMLPKARLRFGMIRRRVAEALKGDGNNRADRTTYSFHHVDGRVFTATRSAFIAAFGASKTSVAQLVAGRILACRGWALSAENAEASRGVGMAQRRAAGRGAKLSARKAHQFVFCHDDGSRMVETRSGMVGRGLLSKSNVSQLVLGKVKSAKGWRIAA